MIHPKTTLRFINEEVGYGLYATEFIPKGTITYVKDSLEVEVSPEDFEKHSKAIQDVIERFSYIDQHGMRVISWDFGKYVNHCCQCNSISTGYGFEIALRDIHPGEQITDEYGIFNLTEAMELQCDKPGCRKVIRPEDFDNHYEAWDEKILAALPLLFEVNQELWPYLSAETINELREYHEEPHRYKSVYTLRYHEPVAQNIR